MDRKIHTLTEAVFAHRLKGIRLRKWYIQLDCSHRRGGHLALKTNKVDNLGLCKHQFSPLSFDIEYSYRFILVLRVFSLMLCFDN